MTMHQIAILGASGYTGAELVRLIATHPAMEVAVLTAERKAGAAMADVFPHLRHLALPRMVAVGEADLSNVDLIFCALPHGTTQEIVAGLPAGQKVVDLSPDFRLRDVAAYADWYGHTHRAPELQEEAVYGLPEFYREAIRSARLVANTGCYVATALLPLVPLIEAGVADPEEIIVDAASGVTGAGRAAKEGMLHAETSEGFGAYGVGRHRHMAEIDQELSRAAGRAVTCSFTPHLLPQNRGILATIYLHADPRAAHETLAARYSDEPFVVVLPPGETPQTRHVRGSNLCHIGVVADRRPGRAIVISALDNLVKGASGQAVQNANLMLGLDETAGLRAAPLFP